MFKPPIWMVILALLPGVSGARAGAEPAADARPDLANPADQHVWDLNGYLKGTAPKIRDQVNGELERLTAKQKALRQRSSGCDTAILAEQAAVIDAVHKSEAYQKLSAEKNQAEATLKAARETGTTQEKLEASSNFNRIRAAMEKMETSAVASDARIPQLLKEKQEGQKELKQCDDAVSTAQKWREKLISAVRCGFMLQWPLDEGASGILGIVTPLEDPEPNSIVVDFDAFQVTRSHGEIEGIKEVSGFNHKVRLHVTGIDTKGLSKGTPVALDRNFVVTRRRRSRDDETIYEVRPEKDDSDRLFELLMPLRELPPPAR